MKKLMLKIKLLIMKWLGVSALIDDLNKQSAELRKQTNKLLDQNKKLLDYQNQVKAQIDMVMDVTQIGVDVSMNRHDRSWAVICIQGKPEYVRFVDLSHSNIREIAEFLRHYEFRERNTRLDIPFSVKRDHFFRF